MSASEAAPEQELAPGAVNVLTMHRGKGLSAKTVIVNGGRGLDLTRLSGHLNGLDGSSRWEVDHGTEAASV
jgi:hypothetical protein